MFEFRSIMLIYFRRSLGDSSKEVQPSEPSPPPHPASLLRYKEVAIFVLFLFLFSKVLLLNSEADIAMKIHSLPAAVSETKQILEN